MHMYMGIWNVQVSSKEVIFLSFITASIECQNYIQLHVVLQTQIFKGSDSSSTIKLIIKQIEPLFFNRKY